MKVKVVTILNIKLNDIMPVLAIKGDYSEDSIKNDFYDILNLSAQKVGMEIPKEEYEDMFKDQAKLFYFDIDLPEGITCNSAEEKTSEEEQVTLL